MSKQKVIICDDFHAELSAILENIASENIFIITDENTKEYCLPALLEIPKLSKSKIITIKSGDSHKNIQTLTEVWQFLVDNGATRKSMIINLGGGMVTDLGGFAASTFKRGARYINIPTTILGAVDAAVGGKTGINFNGLKNEIGIINPAEVVLIDTSFFKSLNRENLLSGMAEILKHALIYSTQEWDKVKGFDIDQFDFIQLKDVLRDSIGVKEKIVEQDPNEQGIRKSLNFGHTVGHAFETFSYETKQPALHGYAVAWGMICELYLSHKIFNFPKDILLQAVALIKEAYGSFFISCKDYDRLFDLMTHDKKNDSKEINFTLLASIGDIKINQHVSQKDIFEALDFYRDSVGI